MRLPLIRGVIERWMLVNYRVEPEVLARQLPAPFEPKLQNGKGLVGICLIRLRGIRPRFVPEALGIRSENAAHRAAVVWTDAQGLRREGVYIRRRYTDSRLNALAANWRKRSNGWSATSWSSPHRWIYGESFGS